MGERARVREIIEKVRKLKDAFLEAIDQGEQEFHRKPKAQTPVSRFSNTSGTDSNTSESQLQEEDDLGI